jgi:hypothetical protein
MRFRELSGRFQAGRSPGKYIRVAVPAEPEDDHEKQDKAFLKVHSLGKGWGIYSNILLEHALDIVASQFCLIAKWFQIPKVDRLP